MRDPNKLIEAKRRWAREGRLLTGGTAAPAGRRLPPGQRLVKDWPVLDLGTHPNVPARDWRLKVGGRVARPLDWRLEELGRAGTVERTVDIHCVTAWSRYDNRFAGVPFRTLAEAAGPLPDARFVILKSHDSYATNLALADLMDDDVLLATHWEGRPLSREHGGPVRLVLPKLYFWKSAKWLRSVWFTDRDAKGYWEARGYHNRGDPWREERYG